MEVLLPSSDHERDHRREAAVDFVQVTDVSQMGRVSDVARYVQHKSNPPIRVTRSCATRCAFRYAASAFSFGIVLSIVLFSALLRFVNSSERWHISVTWKSKQLKRGRRDSSRNFYAFDELGKSWPNLSA